MSVADLAYRPIDPPDGNPRCGWSLFSQDGAGEGGGISDPSEFGSEKENAKDFALWKVWCPREMPPSWAEVLQQRCCCSGRVGVAAAHSSGRPGTSAWSIVRGRTCFASPLRVSGERGGGGAVCRTAGCMCSFGRRSGCSLTAAAAAAATGGSGLVSVVHKCFPFPSLLGRAIRFRCALEIDSN